MHETKHSESPDERTARERKADADPAIQARRARPSGTVVLNAAANASEAAEADGPDRWTLRNAASALGLAIGGDVRLTRALLDRMFEAAQAGALIVRDPQTDLSYRPRVVRDFYDLVTPRDVNEWLQRSGATYRWLIDRPAGVQVKRLTAPQAHQAAIMNWFEREAIDPGSCGDSRSGVKKRVCQALELSSTRPGGLARASFNRAWQALRDEGKIAGE